MIYDKLKGDFYSKINYYDPSVSPPPVPVKAYIYNPFLAVIYNNNDIVIYLHLIGLMVAHTQFEHNIVYSEQIMNVILVNMLPTFHLTPFLIICGPQIVYIYMIAYIPTISSQIYYALPLAPSITTTDIINYKY